MELVEITVAEQIGVALNVVAGGLIAAAVVMTVATLVDLWREISGRNDE